MNGTVRWTYVSNVSSDAKDEYKQSALRQAKLIVSRKIYEVLEQFPTPAVVKIDEKITQRPMWMPRNEFDIDWWKGIPSMDEIKITVEVTPVRYSNIQVVQDHNELYAYPMPLSFLERLRLLIKMLKRRM